MVSMHNRGIDGPIHLKYPQLYRNRDLRRCVHGMILQNTWSDKKKKTNVLSEQLLFSKLCVYLRAASVAQWFVNFYASEREKEGTKKNKNILAQLHACAPKKISRLLKVDSAFTICTFSFLSFYYILPVLIFLRKNAIVHRIVFGCNSLRSLRWNRGCCQSFPDAKMSRVYFGRSYYRHYPSQIEIWPFNQSPACGMLRKSYQ